MISKAKVKRRLKRLLAVRRERGNEYEVGELLRRWLEEFGLETRVDGERESRDAEAGPRHTLPTTGAGIPAVIFRPAEPKERIDINEVVELYLLIS